MLLTYLPHMLESMQSADGSVYTIPRARAFHLCSIFAPPSLNSHERIIHFRATLIQTLSSF